MIAGALIGWAARQHGDRPSLVLRDRSVSHAEVDARSNRLANALIALGLQPGERVAVLLENSEPVTLSLRVDRRVCASE